ncbi:MAG TPA: MarR family transcriptional regulator [Burkholderiaceae bacterium]|nr:MarR family transcriptional regulator [Burkholderiaceae bacterium]HMX12413.1 MarR family transcriptional regulator [Burkholderiaceae bacterium]HMZ01103.1 MarR family transcriptional regulator [Burkholderiaceae bacterium]HNB47228.1 MarR family transcriptional regulator [Burkholderiaceae bacterium]HNG82738.1 MarR family transcriptional regulator [Burkholderiaceae bacterium]
MQNDSDPPRFYEPGQYRPDESVGYLMKKVITSILAQADRRLGSCDLTYAQWLPLYKLVVNDCQTMAGMARDLEIDPGAMTRSLDRLEAKGLVRRERSTEDRRVVNLVLTDEGQAVARQVPPVLAEVLNGHLQGFSEAEWRQLLSFLQRMLANGEAMRAQLPPK